MRPVAQIAQSVEQGIENPRVGGSIPSLGTTTAKPLMSYGFGGFLFSGGANLFCLSLCRLVTRYAFQGVYFQ